MWHEGSHSSDVNWFRAKLEWGKGGQENVHLGGIIVCFGCHKNKYTYLIEQVFFSVWQKQDQATKDFLLMDFMLEAQQFTKQIILLKVQKFNATHASKFGSV